MKQGIRKSVELNRAWVYSCATVNSVGLVGSENVRRLTSRRLDCQVADCMISQDLVIKLSIFLGILFISRSFISHTIIQIDRLGDTISQKDSILNSQSTIN